jgi:hypothetical protein
MKKEALIPSTFEEYEHEPSPGFCFELLKFLWYEENAFGKMKDILAKRNCPFKNQCKIYKKTIKKYG